MKRRSWVHLFVVFSSFVNASCRNELHEAPLNGFREQEVVMEMFTHSTLVQQMLYMNEQMHACFMSSELRKTMEETPFLASKWKSATLNETDTVFNMAEIPFVKVLRSHSKVCAMGRLESTMEEITPNEANDAYFKSGYSTDVKHGITKTVLKEGYMYGYNRLGELVIQEKFELPLLKNVIDTVRLYLQRIENNSTDTLCSEWQQLCTKIYSTRHDELNLYEATTHDNLKVCKSNIRTRTVTELDADLNRPILVKKYRGNQLTLRRRYSYSAHNALTNWHKQKALGTNPCTIVTEKLEFCDRGWPFIEFTIEYYHRNQILFH